MNNTGITLIEGAVRKYCYGSSEEFTGECPSREDAIIEGAAELLLEPGDTIHTAEIIPWAECMDGFSVVDDVTERADEYLGQETGAEDSCFTLPKEFHAPLQKLITDFLLAHGECHRWKVEKVQAHVLPEVGA